MTLLRTLLLISVLGLLGLEGLLRWGFGFGDPVMVERDPKIEYRLIPGSVYHRFGNRIEINSHGMRAAEHPKAPLPGERRVLLIGDSVIYGGHFLDQSETIAAQMDDAFQAQNCDGRTIPAAASSWGPVNQAAFLAETGLFDADLGLFVVSGHDLFDTPQFDAQILPYRLQPAWTALDDVLTAVLERLASMPPHEDSIAERETATRAALTQLAAQFREAGVPLVLIYHPTVSERTGVPDMARETFFDWADANGIARYDLGDASLSAEDYRDTIHPNTQGAAAIARILSALALDQLPVTCVAD